MSWKKALITSRFWHLPNFSRGLFFHRHNNERYCSAFCTCFFALFGHMPWDRQRCFYDTAIFWRCNPPICFNLYNTSTDRKLNFTSCILLFFELSMLLLFFRNWKNNNVCFTYLRSSTVSPPPKSLPYPTLHCKSWMLLLSTTCTLFTSPLTELSAK